MAPDNFMKDVKVTSKPGSLILSKNGRSLEIQVFSPEEVARLQEIAERICAEKAARRNKLLAKQKQK